MPVPRSPRSARSALTLEMWTLTEAEGFPPLPDIVRSSERTPRELSAAVKVLASHMVESFRDELHDSRVNTKDWGTGLCGGVAP